MDLVATEKGDRSADAVDRRQIAEVAFEVEGLDAPGSPPPMRHTIDMLWTEAVDAAPAAGCASMIPLHTSESCRCCPRG